MDVIALLYIYNMASVSVSLARATHSVPWHRLPHPCSVSYLQPKGGIEAQRNTYRLEVLLPRE